MICELIIFSMILYHCNEKTIFGWVQNIFYHYIYI